LIVKYTQIGQRGYTARKGVRSRIRTSPGRKRRVDNRGRTKATKDSRI